MAEKKRGLGKGLSALLGDFAPNDDKAPADERENQQERPPQNVAESAATQNKNAAPTPQPPTPQHSPSQQTNQVRTLSIDQLTASRSQPRQNFADESLASLAQSLKEKGVLQPLLVRPAQAGSIAPYEIIAGERRWRAAQKAQLHEVPVIIHNVTDGESLEVAIVENIQRADLNPIEEAQAYRRLMMEFNYTQDMLAKKLGKSRSHIANMLRLNNVTEKIRQSLIDEQITIGHARALLGCAHADDIAARIIAEGLSVRMTEKLVAQTANDGRQPKTRSQAKPKDVNIRDLEKSVEARLGLQVDIRHKGERGGDMRIRYKTLEQLEDVVRRLINFTAKD